MIRVMGRAEFMIRIRVRVTFELVFGVKKKEIQEIINATYSAS